MSSSNNKEWILPASIPFADLKRTDLEECVYWLLDAMGAKNLEWREGGTGGGAADGGRDLEAQFFIPNDDGELFPQKWWIECKGRSKTVEPQAVRDAVTNAVAFTGLDTLIIVTNSLFSNPTRDWVREWQLKYPKPRVELWDRNQLERYLSRHPDVVLRLFSEALSPDGQYQAMTQRFWNKIEYIPTESRKAFWKERYNIKHSEMGIFALIANEFANGNISHRPWGAVLDAKTLYETLNFGLVNVIYLISRSSRGKTEQSPIVRTISYLILVSLDIWPASVVAELVTHSLFHGKLEQAPESMREYLLMPIVDQLLSEMQEVCSSDCSRMSSTRTVLKMKNGEEIEKYWLRLEGKGAEEVDAPEEFLLIEGLKQPCAVGFSVDETHSCPLFSMKPDIENIEAILTTIKQVADFRRKQSAKKNANAQKS